MSAMNRVQAWMAGIPAGMDEAGKARVRAEQVFSITRATPVMMVASVCAASILLAAMLQDSREYWAIGWTFVVVAYSAFCYVLTVDARKRRRPLQVSAKVVTRTIWRSHVLGLLWAALPALFFLSGETSAELTIFCLCCAMMGGGAFFLSPIPGAAYAFFGPVLLASIFAVLQIDGMDRTSLISLFVGFGIALARMSQLAASGLVARLQSEIAAERKSGVDSATGLSNLDHFAGEVDVALQRVARFGEGFALVDLRFEPPAADEVEEAGADELVRTLARRLVDLAERTDHVGRIGEQEFAVLLSGVTSAQEAAVAVERLIKPLALPLDLSRRGGIVRWSAGLALAPKDGAGAADIMQAAAHALATAREDADRRVCFFDRSDDAFVDERRDLETDLRRALAERQLYLEFQPIHDLGSQRISSCEALVRWKHPVRGVLSPDVLIPIAERTGLIYEIGEWIIEDACRVLARLPSDMRMAMNISAAQLRGDSVLSTLERALSELGLSARSVDIEVTESLLISRDDPAVVAIGQLAAAGFAITLDDFGTGYASLNYLGRLPLKRVKIDREFVGAMLRDPRHAAIVNAILQLSMSLGLEVTAEGVETREQLEFLAAMGCGSIQGYLISKPLSEGELLALLAGNGAMMVAA